jgi:imidazolonepropionase-like amidohydrolase
MRFVPAAALALFVGFSAGGAAQTPSSTAIYADALVDVRAGRTIQDAAVIVSDGRITYAGARSAATGNVPANAERIDLGRVTLLPGLIDAHVHLALGGAAEANARATVEAGFTTVQDLGAIDTQIITLRDAIDAGRVVGPRVLAAGRWIGVTKGTCDFNGIGVRGAAAFRARVQEQVDAGADVIKVCVTGWLSDARRAPKSYEISDDELQAAIAEAHRLQRRVAVHAISAGGIDAAVRFGADLIVHAGFVESSTVDEMRARSIYLLPTLFSFSALKDDALAVASHLRAAIARGLPIAFGTDAGVIPHGRNAREFEFLRDLGLQPLEVMRTATVNAAAALGMTNDVGVLETRASADVIAVDGDPLQDFAALQRVVFVMSRGAVVKRARAVR